MRIFRKELSDRQAISIQAVIFIALLIFASMILEGCTDSCEVENRYVYFEPVYTSVEEIRGAVAMTSEQEMNNPGKIYFKDGFVFINERGEGIHIINNTDPQSPQNVGFINIPGNFDLAAKGDFLYVDSYIDLVILNIADVNNITEVNRIENIFEGYNSYGFHMDSQLGVVTDWVEAEQLQITESECDQRAGFFDFVRLNNGVAFAEDAGLAPTVAPGANPGVGGSMARFTISGDHLYTVDESSLQSINISNLQSPLVGEKLVIGWGIETIFPYTDKLFIGAQNGMHIVDNSNPDSPSLLSTYSHVQSCDPVVVDGSYAYVTLRSGTECQGFTNQLDVVDISNPELPFLHKTYAMDNPHGLGVDGDALFICDGESGLKVYDKADVNTIDSNQLAHYEDIHAFDVIPLNNVLMLIGEDGLYQYDYSNLDKIRFLSKIDIQANDN
ncbi:MAG: hypothetical protein AAFX87_01085 [Bacteroidota bacterium]